MAWPRLDALFYGLDRTKGEKGCPKTDAFDVKLFVIERFMLVMFVSFS